MANITKLGTTLDNTDEGSRIRAIFPIRNNDNDGINQFLQSSLARMGSELIENDITDNKKYQGVNNHIGGLNSFCFFSGMNFSTYTRVPPNILWDASQLALGCLPTYILQCLPTYTLVPPKLYLGAS